MWRFMILAATLALSSAASAQPQEEQAPPQCRPNASGAVDWRACADAAAPGSAARALALINLATEAYSRADFATAVRLYDEAEGGNSITSDASFHALRGGAYAHVGRNADALAQARYSLAILAAVKQERNSSRAAAMLGPIGIDAVYATILPILHKANAPEFASTMAAYDALPANDWMTLANRAAVLDEVGNSQAALATNTRALALESSHPAVLNNQCYILTRLSRGREALPYCERAVQAAPDIGAVRHSYASALANAGDCRGSERELAEARRLDPSSQEYRSPIACTQAR